MNIDNTYDNTYMCTLDGDDLNNISDMLDNCDVGSVDTLPVFESDYILDMVARYIYGKFVVDYKTDILNKDFCLVNYNYKGTACKVVIGTIKVDNKNYYMYDRLKL